MLETIFVKKVEINKGQGNFGEWTRISLNVDKYLPKKPSHFLKKTDDQEAYLGIQDGTSIEVRLELVKNEKGEFLNFYLPDRLDRLESRIEALEAFMKKPNPITSQDEINVESLPF